MSTKKTHCFNCPSTNVIRYTERKRGGWANAIYLCQDCNSYSSTVLTIGGDTGKANKALKDCGIGTITYHRATERDE